MNDESAVFVLVVFDVEDLNLFLLLLAGSLIDRWWCRERFIVVLNDDLDDGLGRFGIFLVTMTGWC